MYFLLAETEVQSKNTEKCWRFCKGASRRPKSREFLWVQADWQIESGDLKVRRTPSAEAAELRFDNRGLEYLRGKIYSVRTSGGRPARPWKIAAPYFSNRAGATQAVEYWLGVCYGQLRNPDQQIMAYAGVAIDPDFEPVKVALAVAKRREGKVEMSMGDCSRSVKLPRIPAGADDVPLVIESNRWLPKESQDWRSGETSRRGREEVSRSRANSALPLRSVGCSKSSRGRGKDGSRTAAKKIPRISNSGMPL